MAIEEIDVDQLAARLDAGARLIDVREPHEFDEARVPLAESVPLGTVADELDRFRGDRPPLVICRSGGRSRQACELLADLGIEATNVAGGTLAWVASGRAVSTGPA